MASKIKEINEFHTPEAYQLESAEYVKEVDSFALLLRHKKSGARVLVFSNEDDNKVFSIGFRTPPKDSTGIPHIIEHTVLCGSKEFPAKDPFVELVKGSLNTYLNATTYPDKTLYPVASCNEKDFENLMHVYMDAVFYPNIYKEEKIFMQEGWHYELDQEEGEISYNGVVYNEMKGAYSSEDNALERVILQELFPDTTYSHDSGGDPEEIPNLTYENYLDFHKKYYHPVNSYIYLYGDMDVEERLNWMNEHYLKDFSKIELDSTISMQKPFDKMHSVNGTYAISEAQKDDENKTYYAFSTVMDLTMDQKACRAFEVLTYVLALMPGAPLKQAILDAGIGNDVDVEFCDILKQSFFSISTKNAKAGQKEKFHTVVMDTLRDIVKNGVDKKALEATINGYEFREREADYGVFPKGLLYGLKAMKTWLHDDTKPYASLTYESFYEFLREQLKTDYYEQLIQKYIIDNPHAVLIEMDPEPGLATKLEEQEKKQLKEYKESLSKKEIFGLIENTKALKKYQEEPTPKEILEKIPMLELSDIRKEVIPFANKKTKMLEVPAIHHEMHTNDIIYLRILFDAEEYKEYIPELSFLTTLLGYMDTKLHTYGELDTLINFYTGGISTDMDIFCKSGEKDNFELKFEIRVKVLRRELTKAMELMSEILFETLFSDEKHLKEVIAESRSRMKVRLLSSGHQAAAARTGACYSKSSKANDNSVGIGYYEYLADLDDHFEERKESLKKCCVEFLHHICKKERMMVSCAADQKGFKETEKAFEVFLKGLHAFEMENDRIETEISSVAKQYPIIVKKNKEGIKTSSKVQYVAIGGSFSEVPNWKMGSLRVVRHLLNYVYLWNEVRVKGGAYGVSCMFNREGEGYFTSYRDPNLEETLAIYRKAADYLRGYDAEERELRKTIIGTISGMDTPLTPSMQARRSLSAYFTGVAIDVLQKEREQVLSCNIEDIREAADVVQAICDGNNICVIGSEKHVEEAKIFDTVYDLK